MKIKSTISSSGKNERPEKIDKNPEEKASPVQVSQTSNSQPEEQESRMLIPQETKSQPESLSSEESSYYSCEDADDFDKNPEEKTSPVQDEFDDVSLKGKGIPCASTRSRLTLEVTPSQKFMLFQMLRSLAEEPGSLKNGKKREVQHDGKILKLTYMTERCLITIQDLHGHRQFKEVVATQDIYLRWRDGKEYEPLSIKNLFKVWNEMRDLGILGEKMDGCFATVIHEFFVEPIALQDNATLGMHTTEHSLTFVSGKGKHEITVLYDDIVKKPRYCVKTADCWIVFQRRFQSGCGIWKLISPLNLFLNLKGRVLGTLRDWIDSFLPPKK